ncbi:MAG: LysR family transcriptional regulator [Pseudomonadota bacterium]
MYLNLNQLRSFYTAAKTKSITRAAAELCVTPGAVTLQTKQLEEHTGVRLLVRTGNSMQLTDAGAEVYKRTQHIFEQIENLEKFIEDISERKSGVLIIGCSETAAISVVPSIIKEFKKNYPGIKTVLDRGTTKDMIQSLLDRKTELVVVRYGLNDKRLDDKSVKMHYMGKKEIILVAARESVLVPKNMILPEELNDIPIILPIKGSATREIVSEHLKKFSVSPKVIMESSSIAFIKEFTRDDEGVSFVCRDVVLTELSEGNLKEVRISGFTPYIDYGVAYLNRSDLSQAALAFLKTIEKLKAPI